ncbi:MAG: ABC transporter substrate-binding protein [Deinococcota bacterium]|jgi:peptide/nickel transport system substrate-binding protein|nr:ABC transporter substrate-binding protein [Deinococcota bacterium]
MRSYRGVLSTVVLALGLTFAQSGTLEIAVDQSPVGLDPHVATAFSTFAVIGQIYDGLLELNADLQLEPALAESWEVADDGLSYTFTLREGVLFHNGRAMTSEDVVYSFERIMAEATGSPLASRFDTVAEVTAQDEATVVFTLAEPFAPFLANLLSLSVVPREVVEENEGLQQVAVGTGPFVLREWVPDVYLLLEANPDYYREGEPGVAAIRYNIVPEASTRAAGLRSGSYHLLPDVDPATAETLRGAQGVTLLASQDLGYSLLGLNVTRPPLDDARVRRAINLAIDREEIVEAVYFGNAVPGGPLSPGLGDWALSTEEFDCYTPDPEAARALLAEAGYENGFELEILGFGTIRVVSDLAQVVQAQLRDVGIDATVNIEEFGQFVQDWRNSNFDAFVSLNGGSTDPDGYLHRTFYTGGSTNVYLYSDPEVDRLLDEGRTTTEEEARYQVYAELQRKLACEGPIVHVAYATLFSAHREGVLGFEQLPTRGLRHLRNVTLE